MSDEFVPIERVLLAEIVAGDPRAARAVLELLRSMAADFEAEGNDDVRHVGEPTRTRPSLSLVREEPDVA